MTAATLDDYAAIVGPGRIAILRRLAARLAGLRLLVINSTRVGGGVAEMLVRHVPLLDELGLLTRWEVIEGPPEFYVATKKLHNALQGAPVELTPAQREAYLDANRRFAERIDLDADVVIVHDPQPAALIRFATKRCPWIWRCHLDVSWPDRRAWRFLRPFITRYDASVFSAAAFAMPLSHPQYLIAPSIDPLGPKNRELTDHAVDAVLARFGLDRSRPLVVQVSRFDRFKDPLGVIRAFRMARRRDDCRLVLVGGEATDDPEGSEVLREVREASAGDPDVIVLSIPPDSHTEINALQRAADIIVQKSTREGFGLTVTEGLWKARPVIAGAAGGLTLQVFDHQTGFLVHSIEGCAYRIRHLLNRPSLAHDMGRAGRELVRHSFLLTRDLRDWLTLFLALTGRAPA